MELIFNKWANILLKPKEAFKEEKGKAGSDFVRSLINIEVSAAVIGFLYLLYLFTRGYPSSSFDLLFIIAPFILFPIQLFVISGIYFAVARILGGKGDFIVQTYMFSLLLSLIMSSIILFLIPIIGFIVVISLVLYSLYLVIIMLMEVHEFDSLKALMTLLIASIAPLTIIGIFIIAVLFFLRGKNRI